MLRGALLLMLALSAAPALAQPSAESTANAAIEAYKQGKLRKAGALFLSAFELSGEPTQLRNAAKALEEAGELMRSKVLWTDYAKNPRLSFEEREEAKAHVLLIDERLKNAEISKEAKAAQAEAEAARRAMKAQTLAQTQAPPSPVYAFTTMGVGLASVAAGVVLWFISQRELNDLDSKLAQVDPITGRILMESIDRAEATAQLDAINDKRIATGVLTGVGGALVGGGLLWWLLLPKEAPQPSTQLSRNGLSFGLQGRF